MRRASRRRHLVTFLTLLLLNFCIKHTLAHTRGRLRQSKKKKTPRGERERVERKGKFKVKFEWRLICHLLTLVRANVAISLARTLGRWRKGRASVLRSTAVMTDVITRPSVDHFASALGGLLRLSIRENIFVSLSLPSSCGERRISTIRLVDTVPSPASPIWDPSSGSFESGRRRETPPRSLTATALHHLWKNFFFFFFRIASLFIYDNFFRVASFFPPDNVRQIRKKLSAEHAREHTRGGVEWNDRWNL